MATTTGPTTSANRSRNATGSLGNGSVVVAEGGEIQTGAFKGLLQNHYRVIYVDPPWQFKAWSHRGEGRGAVQHYPCMGQDEIKSLPVPELCAEDAVLFLWVVQPMLPEALQLIDAWGFEYRTVAFVWIKVSKFFSHFQNEMFNDEGVDAKMGLGYHTRSETEQCWLAIRGKGYKKKSHAVRQIIYEGLRDHSRKPDQAIERIEQLTGDIPRIELFARQRRNGWDAWGNESQEIAEAAE